MSSLPRPQVLGPVAVATLGVLWLVTGSFVLAVLVLVLVGGTAGLGWVLLTGPSGAGSRPRRTTAPVTVGTRDLSLAPRPGAGLRRVLRLALARPWVRGEGLVRASAARVSSDDALVWMPRGERAGAPHLWVEWNAADAAEIAEQWPLELLARELLDAHDERVRSGGVRRLQERTWLHLLGRDDVPVGRVVVTAAFSAPQDPVLVAVSTPGPASRRPATRAPHPAPGRTVMMGRTRR